MSSGTLVLGVLNGLAIGLLAVGLVLVYKSNRFLNLAHAQLGTLSALVLAKWVLDWHWSWWVAFVLAVAVGRATGLLADRFLVRPPRRRTSSPVRLLLLTGGLRPPSQPRFNVSTLGPSRLMLTWGAAASGACASLPAALGGGLLLGVVARVGWAETSSGAKAEVAVFIVIIGVVFGRGRAIG